MYNLMRYYNQHKGQIWMVILIIALVIVVIQILNNMTKQKRKEEYEEKNNTSTYQNNNLENNNSSLVSKSSSLYGVSSSSDKVEKDGKIIDEFMEYCNEKDIENAYNMLTDECKEVMYPSLDEFKQNYYNTRFGDGAKEYTVENWANDIYKVRIVQDMLSTGKSNKGDALQEYITIDGYGEDKRLNINNYIKRVKYNKEIEQDNITVKIINRDRYFEYEEYEIEVTNNTDKTIRLGNKEDLKSIYIEDINQSKYYFYNNEIIEESLIVGANRTKKFKMKFYSSFSLNRNIKKLIFSKILLDYENYNISTDITKIQIELY